MKVVVLGFDGVEPTLLERLMDEGRLPAFERLADRGPYSTLDSTVVPISAMAWSSFLTGVNPGKHGVFDFVTRASPDSTEFELTTANHRQAPEIWDYLDALDRRAGVIGVPVTYPAQEHDGYTVTGYPTPEPDGAVWPPTLADDAPIDPTEGHADVHFDGTNRQEFIDDQFRQFDAVEKLHQHALSEWDVDVQISVFKQTDDIAHVAWDEPQLHEIYERADDVLDETMNYLKECEEEYALFVLSDHGFGPIDKTLFLNNALRDLGYVELRKRLGTTLRSTLNETGLNLLNAYRIASALGLGESLMSVGYDEETFKAKTLYALRNALLLGAHDIDAESSACFSRGNYGQIFLTDEATVDDLVADLLAYEVDGQEIVADVHRASECFHGPATDIAPDLMIETPEYRYLTARGFALGSNRVLTDHIIGRDAEHKQKGIFFATGGRIAEDADIDEPSLEDLLPTIFTALGVPIPEYVDGSPVEAFEDSVDTETRQFDFDRQADESDLSDDERDELRSKLESLGYAN